jgi:hypothetical protein
MDLPLLCIDDDQCRRWYSGDCFARRRLLASCAPTSSPPARQYPIPEEHRPVGDPPRSAPDGGLSESRNRRDFRADFGDPRSFAAAEHYAMEPTHRCDMVAALRSQVWRMTSAEWKAIGEDAKHVEDGRYYVLVPNAQGPRVVEIQFTDRHPRRVSVRRRSR